MVMGSLLFLGLSTFLESRFLFFGGFFSLFRGIPALTSKLAA